MAKKEKKDIVSDPNVLAEKLGNAETWVESNPKIVFGVLFLLLIVVGGYFGYRYYANNQEVNAQRDMMQATFYWEADSLEKALKGDGNNLGLLDVVDDYGSTEAANLANFYSGVAYLKQGKFEAARLFLEEFSSNDLLVQARAYALIGDSYMEEEKYEDAASYYSKAARYKPNEFFSPNYLMKEARAYEKLNQIEKAKAAYQTIIDEYPTAEVTDKAKKLQSRLSPKS